MFDRLVADGDRTTTGGEVIGRSDFYNEDGKMYARKENHATCGNCKGGWPIYGTAGNWMDNGLPYVKDMDRVLCHCGKNFVLASGGSTAFYSDSKGGAQTERYITCPTTETYDERFTLRDGRGSPLANTSYTVESEETLTHGVTDSLGRTERHTTDGAQSIHVYLGHRESA